MTVGRPAPNACFLASCDTQSTEVRVAVIVDFFFTRSLEAFKLHNSYRFNNILQISAPATSPPSTSRHESIRSVRTFGEVRTVSNRFCRDELSEKREDGAFSKTR
ncbi:hypothetical protein MTP99_016190 [Tenebrio molitor]|nr:hypothetical protein MTP99_016190 [Tenebrio molitor]